MKKKIRLVDLMKGESFSFLGFDIRRVRTLSDKWGVLITPRMKARTNLLHKSQGGLPAVRLAASATCDRAVLTQSFAAGLNYFRDRSLQPRFLQYIKDWVEKKIRRHLMRARKRKGFGWNRWSRVWLYKNLGLFMPITR